MTETEGEPDYCQIYNQQKVVNSIIMSKGAEFSACGKYRYVLWRVWDNNLPLVQCIALNPSTANSDDDDPTIRRLISLLTAKGYGGFYMTNLFALISFNPDDIRASTDPLKDNDLWLVDTYKKCDDVLFCWGTFKTAQYRAKIIIPQYPDALCFGRTKDGSPKHPAGFIRAGIMNEDIHIEKFKV